MRMTLTTMRRLPGFRPISLAVCLLLAVSAVAQTQPPLIPRSVLFGNPERSSPQISPDGAMLAYLAPDQGVLNIWVRTLGKTDDRAVTNDRKRGIRNLFCAVRLEERPLRPGSEWR
jgi:hypothetical protein